MAIVKHLGFFPWCVYNSKQDFLEKYVLPFGETGLAIYGQNINIFESLPLGLVQSLALYWRVKAWRVTGFFQVSSGSGENVFSNIQNIPFDFVSTRDAGTERDLICINPETGTYPDLITNYSVSYTVPNFDFVYTSFDFGLNIGVVNFPTSFENYGFYNGSSIINNFIYFQFGHIDGEDSRFASWINNSISSPSVSTNVNLSWLDQNVSLKAFIKDSYSGLDNPVILNAQANIAASEYWEYDTEDGKGPIYDRTTGAILRPEFFER